LRTLGMAYGPADKEERQDASGPPVSVPNHARTISGNLLREAPVITGYDLGSPQEAPMKGRPTKEYG
jgi:hypothetical protein